MKEEGSHPLKEINSQSYTDREHQQSLSNYLKVNCEPLITSGNCRKKTLLANYISKSFRLTATYFSMPPPPISLSFASLISFPLPNFLLLIEGSSVKAAFPFAAAVFRRPVRTPSKIQSTGEQLAQIYHYQLRNKASCVSLTQTASPAITA